MNRRRWPRDRKPIHNCEDRCQDRLIYEREGAAGERRPARMSDQAIYDVVKKRQRTAGVK